MRLKWYGHAAFQITSTNGFRIITDPYTPEGVGYAPIKDTAELVMMSSNNDDAHCRGDLIPGNPTIVNALEIAQGDGTSTVHDIKIQAIEAMEILSHPDHEPDQDGMYRFEIDGFRIAHMGDVGNPLSEKQSAFFNDVDVLAAR